MRCLGQIDGRQAAEKFVAHLLTMDIATHIDRPDPTADQWEVWVREEDKLDQARSELATFLSDPFHERYESSLAKATKILEEKEQARQQAVKNQRRMNMSTGQRLGTRGPMPPMTLTLLILCILLGLLSNFSNPGPNNTLGQTIDRQLSFAVPEDVAEAGGDPAANLKRGEVWRAITPIFRHIGPIHLAMNMLMLASFGRIVERWVGTPRFALMVLVLAIVPNLFQGLSPEWMRGDWRFGGISGVLYGFFGYVWIRSTLNPQHGIVIPFPIVVMLIGLIVIGLLGVFDSWRLADLAHLGGLLVGCSFGFASEQAPSSSPPSR